MSMLAERKQKQKWTLNPRGKYWSDDSNKFGQKMLEKMGWSAGKGLGAKEDGITEHIKQSYKNDTKGVGFEDREDQWTQHESDFSNLLQSLSNADDTTLKKPEVSLEEKSQTSRKRVHYHKFTRGKDLSRYSEKDLANIFGRKTLEKQQNVDSSNDDSNSNSNTAEFKEYGVITVNGGSMTDYFKTKLKTAISNITKEEQSDDERPGFGFSHTTTSGSSSENKESHSTFTSKFMSMFTKSTESLEKTLTSQENPSEEVDNENKEIKSKKKKNKTKVVINECFDNMGFKDFPDVTRENSEENNPQDAKKKRKKGEIDSGYENGGFVDFNPESVKKSKKRKLETIIEESTIVEESSNNFSQEKPETTDNYTPAKKKSKKQKNKDKDEIQITSEEDSKKSKRKKKGLDNAACTELDDELQTIEEESSKKTKSKKKKGIDNVACTELGEENLTFENSNVNVKKKKDAVGICNEACTELDKENNVVDENVDLKTQTPKTKKKKKTNSDVEVGIYNVACTEDNKDDLQECVSDVVEIKSSKKKKKKDDLGVSNPACTENSNDSIVLEENEMSVSGSVKKAKKKKSKDNGVDNLACTANSMQQNLEEAISSMSNAIDDYQLELENQMNEKKALKKNEDNFKPKFKSNRNFNYAKKSIKTVIKGELRYEFEGSNLPKIPGYGIDR